MQAVDWYFDFISPFAYLQSTQLARIEAHATLRRVPVLFAGLLNHWGNKGPAEIAPKRQWTFEHIAWIAHQQGIALEFPATHPFNPLPLLRASQCLGNTPAVVERVFRFVWADGSSPEDPQQLTRLFDELGVSEQQIQAGPVKDALRLQTEAAASAGVFGVPTLSFDQRRFWGFDATDIALAALAGDPFFDSNAWRAAAELPEGRARRQPNSG